MVGDDYFDWVWARWSWSSVYEMQNVKFRYVVLSHDLDLTHEYLMYFFNLKKVCTNVDSLEYFVFPSNMCWSDALWVLSRARVRRAT